MQYRAKPSTTRKRAASAYILRILLQGKPANPGLPGLKGGEFRLPLAPANITYEDSARTQMNAVTGGNQVDEHGLNPPSITIGGTFGEATRGGMDGIEWQRALEGVIRWYMAQNLKRGLARQPLYIMEWHDTFVNQSWVVTPRATPWGIRDASKPVTESYTLRLDGVRSADTPKPAQPLALSLGGLCPFFPGCQSGGPADAHCPFRGTA
jgi:hypothetical protein